GLLSALFLNDTICLMFAPFLIHLTDELRRNPLPYLIALAAAANIGSTATLTGNPQNMIVGIASGISYLEFSLALAPIALLSMGIIWVVLVKMYPYEMHPQARLSPPQRSEQAISKPMLFKTLAV